ncbi:MAG: 2Fe-2S iron-sulfur cluster binding domain-containing protein [Gammaproteobacteria bacterium]|nr:2Fe-2S iron-sulfur cluster binding domain-containing protein [Gammaproteobacteria bacterium]
MLFYIGIILLSLISLQLLIFAWQQLRSYRHNQRSHQLEIQLLKAQLAEKTLANTIADATQPGWSGWRKFRVRDIVKENRIIKSYYLVPHDGKPPGVFLPGQHLTFKLKVSGLSKPVIRCYTLSDSPKANDYYRVTIRKQTAPAEKDDAVDGVASCYFHEQLKPGDILDVKSPNGKFFLDTTENSPVVLIAGGVGLTPALSMLNTLLADRSERDIWLFYGARDHNDQIMTEHFKLVQQQLNNFHLFKLFSDENADVSKDLSAHKGRVTTDFIQQQGTPLDSDFFICGPAGMMKTINDGLRNLGVDEQRIHFESFGPASIKAENRKVNTDNTTDTATHKLEFGLSGKSVEWNQSSGTVLDAAEAAGIQIDSGCRAGSCGTCLTAVLEGQVSYVEEPGMTVEDGSFLPCVAIPKSNLKLNA